MKILAKRSVSHTEHDQVIHPKLRMMRNSSGRVKFGSVATVRLPGYRSGQIAG